MSAPWLSVVIPVLNERAGIEAVLARALGTSGLEAVEVLVVDGGSADGTAAIASRRARVLQAPRGRASQMNAGAHAARGLALLFCHGDTLLPEGYGLAVWQTLQDRGVAGGAFTPRYGLRHPAMRLAEGLVSLPAAHFMFGDAALFGRRAALEAVGFFPEVPLMEDVMLVRALKGHGRLVRLPQVVHTSGRRFHERGVVRQLWLDLRLLLAFYSGVDPSRLAPRYAVTGRDRAVGGGNV